MKKYNILFYILLIIICFFAYSCINEDDLAEMPKGFLTAENTFTNLKGFESAVGRLYEDGRQLVTTEASVYVNGDFSLSILYGSGTDIGWFQDRVNFFNNYDLVNSTDNFVRDLWNQLFRTVKDCNVIITRLESSTLSEGDKQSVFAQARFFRAFAYRYLVHLYGDVPLITEEITSPKLDFVRTPKSAILDFMIEDLIFASQNLPVANPGDGRLSKAAADHLLTETYIANGEYDKAIEASSSIINDGQYKLMTNRFGTLANKTGDVFWDLFRDGNQNGKDGNTESILVWQMEYGVEGGMAQHNWERTYGPYIQALLDSENKKAILPADSLGRGVGFFTPGPYLEFTIWESDWDNDIRNSKFNMQRVFWNNNPESVDFGKPIPPRPEWINRSYHVWIKKASCPYGHPQGYDPDGEMFTDIYAIRLAETFLLRAEAYLGKGDKVKAAADINVVRSRANANPVDPADVDIDYILDERARELCIEEPRRLTLCRLGLLYERVVKYNPISSSTVKPFHNLFPIPQTAIDANSGAEFPQNPGYQ